MSYDNSCCRLVLPGVSEKIHILTVQLRQSFDLPLNVLVTLSVPSALHIELMSSISLSVNKACFIGVLSSIELLDASSHACSYRIEIDSLLHPLSLNTSPLVFNNRSLKFVLMNLLRPFLKPHEVVFKHLNKIMIPRLVYKDDDHLAVFKHLCFKHGLFYQFDYERPVCQLDISDALRTTPVKAITSRDLVLKDAEELVVHVENNAFVLGQCLTLNNNPFHPASTVYRVAAVEISVDQTAVHGGSQKSVQCRSVLSLLPLKVEPRRQFSALKPRGLHAVQVVGESDSVPNLDEEGRYTIRFPFKANSVLSGVVHAQMLSGLDSGWHFPLRHAQEAIVLPLLSELTQSKLLGSLCSEHSKDPVTSTNAYQHVWRTFSGHELIFNERAADAGISLNTEGGAQQLQLRNSAILLSNKKGLIQCEAAQSMQLSAGKMYRQTVGGRHVISVGGDFSTISKEGKLSYRVGQHLRFKAGQTLSLKAGERMVFQSDQYQAFAQYRARLKADAIHVDVPKGPLILSSGKAIVFKGGLSIKVGASELNISETGATLSGTKVAVIGM